MHLPQLYENLLYPEKLMALYKRLVEVENRYPHLMTFIRYGIAGVVAVAVQFGFLIFFVEKGGYDPTLSSGIGFIFSCVVNYYMLYYWTFKSKGSHRIAFIRYS